jgi:hypothetical protein
VEDKEAKSLTKIIIIIIDCTDGKSSIGAGSKKQ